MLILKIFYIERLMQLTKRSLSSYSWLIILLGVFLLSGLWLLVHYQVNDDYDRTMEETSKETMNLAKSFEEHVSRIIADTDEDLLNLKETYERNGISSSLVTAYGKTSSINSSRNLISIYNEQGIVIQSLRADVLGLNSSDREYFQFHQYVDSQKLYIGLPIIGKLSGETSIPLTRRINKPDGSFGGIVYISLNAEYLRSFYQKIDLGENSLICVMGMDGFNRIRQVGSNTDTGQDVRGGAFWQSTHLGPPYGTLKVVSATDKITRIVSYRHMPEYPLMILVGKSTQAALTASENRKHLFLLAACLVSIFILIFSFLLVKRYEESKRLMEMTHREKDQLLALINSISDEVWFINTEKKITLANPAGRRQFCSNSSETDIEQLTSYIEVRRPDGSLRPIEETPAIRALHGQFITNEHEIIHSLVTGEIRHREVSATPVRDINNNIIGSISIAHDTTKQKAMESELERHRDNLQSLVEEQVREIHDVNAELTAIFSSISDPFYVLDKEWRLTHVNEEAMQAIIKLDKTHIGQNIWQAFPEWVGGERYLKCHEARATNKPTHAILGCAKRGKLFDTHLYPYENGLIVYFRDITEQKKYEAELSRIDRLNLIGEMAAGIGHEIRNPMTTVRGYLQWFMQKEQYVEYQEQFTTMIEELDRANAIITEYLSLAKNKSIELKQGSINSVLIALFPLLQAEAYYGGHELQIEINDTPNILLDDSQLRQLVLNLVRNGFEAMSPGSTLTIKLYVENDEAVLAINDTGKGIPQVIMDNLGTPFVTTKDNGTGLGLAVCYRIAERHGAKINVDTSAEGTTFYVNFQLGSID